MVKYCVVGEAKQVISLVKAMKSIFSSKYVRKKTYTEVFWSMHRLASQLILCVSFRDDFSGSLPVFFVFKKIREDFPVSRLG